MMNEELYAKLNVLLGQISKSLSDIKKNGRKARELKKSVENSRKIVTEVLEQQLGGVSLEAQICISEIPDEDWLITARHIIDYINDPFVPINQYENYFSQLVNYLLTTNSEKLLSNLVYSIKNLQQEDLKKYLFFEETYNKKYLTNISLLTADFTELEAQLKSIKQHSYDYLWLYRKLEDFTSKRTLAAILINWIDLQTDDLDLIRSSFSEYCEPDIFVSNENKTLIDVGAGIGVAIDNYTKVYGKIYKKIYAYEMSPNNYTELCEIIEDRELDNVETAQKCIGNISSKLFVDNKKSDNDIKLFDADEKPYSVDIIRIDDKIKDAVDIIIIDAGGEEQSVIEGSVNTIRKNRPYMAINVDSSYELLWRIPTKLLEIHNDYKLYIRHYGNSIVPTEFVMYFK